MNLTAGSVKYTILIIDDRPDDLKIMANCLEEADFKIMAAQNGESGLDIAQRAQPDLILLDVLMPGIDGFETCRRLKAEASTQEIPVIFMTSLAETEHKITGFEVGGVDYITKPIQVAEVLARVKAHLASRILQKQLEAQNAQLQQEIAERKQVEAALRQSEARLRALIDNLPFEFWAMDSTLRYIMQNAASLKNYGNVVGKRIEELGLPVEIAAGWVEEDRKVLQGEILHGEYEREVGGEKRVYENLVAPVVVDDAVAGIVGVSIDITEHKRAEQKEKEQLQFLQTLLNTIPNPIFYKNAAGRYTGCNKAFEDFIGKPTEAIIGHTVYDMGPKEIADKYHEKDLELLENPGKQHYEWQVVGKGGKIREVFFDKATLMNAAGHVDGLIGVISDITELKQAEQALRESEERLRQIASSLREVIWLRDAQTRQVLYVNPAFEELTGRTCQNFYENRDIVIDAIHPDDKVWVIEALDQRLEGVPFDTEHRIVHLDGSARWVSSRSFPVRNEAGEVYRWASIMEDITERKQAEQALKVSEARLAGIISSINDLIFTFDQEGRFTFYGSSAQERLYLDEKLFIGKSHAEVMPPHITALFEQAFARNKEGVVAEYDYCLEVGGQTGWYAAKLSPLLVDGKFTGSVAVIRNITERKRVEEALQTRTRELGERVKELNCLYGIANLIQTPNISLTDILQGVAALIPAAWQYPAITCAQIIIEGQVSVKTKNFAVIPWRLTAPIIARGERIGAVEVGYLEEKPANNKGPFLPEERRLLNAIAERLGRIIEQLQAEKTLHETEAKWRSLAETAPATIATLDRQGTILFINRPLLTEGLPRLVIGSSIYQYLSPQEQERTRKIIEGVFQSGGVVRYETTAIKSDGCTVCVENRIAPIKVGAYIIAVTYMALDITTRKQAEEALRESESRYKHLLESVADYIYTVKIEQNQSSVTYHHVGCEAVTGYTSEEYEADPNLWFRMVYDEDRSAVAYLASRLMAGETAAPLEHRLIHKDGSLRWVRNTTVPKYDEQGNLVTYVGLITDITAHKRAEEALRQAHDELEKRVNERMAELTGVNQRL